MERNYRITGKTLIPHSKRTKLGISNDLYVVVDALLQFKKIPTYGELYKKIGIDVKYLKALTNEAYKLKLIQVDEKGNVLSGKQWSKIHGTDNSEQFEKFWEPIKIENDLISWHGSKPEAKSKFKEILKLISFEELMEKKVQYFTVLQQNPKRYKMNCASFIDPVKQKFQEDFESQIIRKEKKVNGFSDNSEILTSDKLHKLHE